MLVHAKVRVGARSDGGYWKSPQLGYGTCQVNEDWVNAGLGCSTYQLTYETEAEPTRQLHLQVCVLAVQVTEPDLALAGANKSQV